MSAFCQLHNHCDHSLLDGLGGPGVWVDAAIEKGFSALALTDHGSVSSALEFVKYARERGITPIVGCEFYFTDDVDYRPSKKTKERFPRYHLIVLAKNWDGLQNIFAQLTLANEQFYYKPLLSLDQIYKFKNCVVMTACAVGVLHHPNYSAICHKLKDVYGGDFYLEIMPHQLEMQKEVNLRALTLSEMSGIEPVATNDAHYPRVEDTLTHDVMLAIQTNSTIDKEGRFSFLDGEEPLDGLYLKTQTEMIHSFKPWIEDGTLPMSFVARAIRNTGEIAAKCSGIEVPKLDFALPTVREIKDEPKYLMELIMAGWQEKIAGRVGNEPEYVARLKYELGVITKIGAVRYFLIVHDIVSWARMNNILCGFGRGSAGGSLVAYLLGITGLDPIRYELYFERFLREDRIDMPDIDLDFAGKAREQVLKYVADTYGAGNVCQISTCGYMHGKTAFRDVARVFGIPYMRINELSKRIDNDLSIAENFTVDAELEKFAKEHPGIVRHAVRLDGQLRNKGVHAGGVLISEDGYGSRGVVEKRTNVKAINWHMDECEHFGLLKVDILGLNNLYVLKDTADLVLERRGIRIDYHTIEPNDPEVLAMFHNGHTAGFFQFESDGITGLAKRLAPITDFETLIHINALYRPGPLDSGMVETYVRRYRKEESVAYLHPKEAEITEKTLGLPIFQEQVMAYFVRLAGFSWPEADNMRKIIAKSKGVEKLEEKRPEFVSGCARTVGMSVEVANMIYDNICAFGRYGFGRSHAACYSLISYLTAWAKYHYPAEFMASLLRSVTTEAETTARYVKDARRMGLSVKGPDVNLSGASYSIQDDKTIVAGFSSIKGVGPAAAEIIQSAGEGGDFTSYQDFLDKTPRRTVNKRVIEALARAGAFETLEPNARWIVDFYPEIIKSEAKRGEIPSPGGYPIWDEGEVMAGKVESVPGVFTGDEIEIKAEMTIDKDILKMLQDEILACDKCEHVSASSPVPFKFSANSRILAIMPNPNPRDEAAGEPMSGKVRTMFMELAREHLGLTPGNFLIANMFNCRPKGKSLSKEQLEKCECPKIHISRLIKATDAKVVLAFGNPALAYFTGKTYGINKASGTTFYSPEHKVMVVFANSPASLLFDTMGDKRVKFVEAINVLKTYI